MEGQQQQGVIEHFSSCCSVKEKKEKLYRAKVEGSQNSIRRGKKEEGEKKEQINNNEFYFFFIPTLFWFLAWIRTHIA